MLRNNAIGFGSLNQKTPGKFFQRIRELVTARLFLRPGSDLIDPFPLIATVKLAPVDPGVFDNGVDLADRLNPFLLNGCNLRDDFFVARGQRFIRRRWRFNDRGLSLEIALNGAQKLLRAFPQRMYRFGDVPL